MTNKMQDNKNRSNASLKKNRSVLLAKSYDKTGLNSTVIKMLHLTLQQQMVQTNVSYFLS